MMNPIHPLYQTPAPKPNSPPEPKTPPHQDYLRAAIIGTLSAYELDLNSRLSYSEPDEPSQRLRKTLDQLLAELAPVKLYERPEDGVHSLTAVLYWRAGCLSCSRGVAHHGTIGQTKVTRLSAGDFEVLLCGHLRVESVEEFYRVIGAIGQTSQVVEAICDVARAEAQDELRKQAKTALEGFLGVRL